MQRTKFKGVFRLADGRFQTIAIYTDPRTNKRRKQNRTWSCATAQEALILRDAERVRAVEGATPQRMRFAQYASSWLTAKARDLAPSTLSRYAHTITVFAIPTFGELFIDAIAPADVLQWRDALARKGAPESTNGHLRIVKSIFAHAADELQIRDPAKRVKQVAKAQPSDSRALSSESLGRVLAELRDLDLESFAALLTLALTGIRYGELSALHWADVDTVKGELFVRRSQWRGIHRDVTKTKTSRKVPLVPELAAILPQLREHQFRTRSKACPLVFAGSAGETRSRTWMAKHLDACITRADVPRVTLHGLRHTWSDLLRRVASHDVQKAITGHSTEAMREHYSHVDSGEKMGAATSVMRLVRPQ